MAAVRRLAVACLVAGTLAGATTDPPLPQARVNDNRRPAGRRISGVHTVRLVAQRARWHPEADRGPSLEVEAFGEEGRGPEVPGPLIRVRAGQYIFVSVRNTLADTLLVLGFGHRHPHFVGDTLRVAPGETAARRFTAADPGTYLYYGSVLHDGKPLDMGAGGQLAGALVVDTAGTPPDRVFLMSVWETLWDSSDSNSARRAVFAINGKSWPYTERQHLALGDTAHWRILDATGAAHPMHLHGFYFRVNGRTSWEADTAYPAGARPMQVTEVPPPRGASSITWVPHTPGRWLFHCHRAFHMSGERHEDLSGDRSDTVRIHTLGRDHASRDMAGLILGIEVTANGRTARDTAAQRPLRLLAQPHAGYWGAKPAYGYAAQRGPTPPAPDSVVIPGPVLELARGERTAITVVNRLPEPTSVHWHGIELESASDGVAGWSGVGTAVAPLIMPGDSFTAHLAPPRAGTFIYHTHVNELVQMPGGLIGPLLVLEPGLRRDPASDHVIVLHDVFDGDSVRPAINGSGTPPRLELRAGRAHRLRLIAIFPQRVGEVRLSGADSLAAWRPLARDGADLPAARTRPREARVAVTPGETFDFEFFPPTQGDYTLTLECPKMAPVVLWIVAY